MAVPIPTFKSSNWGELPLDILNLILDKLFTLSDYSRFSAVCKHWLHACEKQKHFRFDPNNKQLPLLFIPNRFPGHEKNTKPSLYNPVTAELHDTELQWDYDRRCCGSCFGWLATIDINLAVSLTNPFLGKTIKFPSFREGGTANVDEPYELIIQKLIVTKDPLLFPNDFVVVAIHYHYWKFSCIKAGETSWVEVDDKGLKPFSDIIIHNDLLYAVGYCGGVGSLDMDTEFDSIGSKLQVIIPDDMDCAEITYLVESSQGELLQIRRFLDGDTKYKTYKFDIFKLVNDDDDRDSEEGRKRKWSEVESLGEDHHHHHHSEEGRKMKWSEVESLGEDHHHSEEGRKMKWSEVESLGEDHHHSEEGRKMKWSEVESLGEDHHHHHSEEGRKMKWSEVESLGEDHHHHHSEEGRKMKWSEVESLGEDALFLGDNYSTSILMTNFPNCKSNCIYYTDNLHDDGYERPSESFDNGIYDVAERSFGSHYIIPSSHKYLPPPIWILPT